MAKKPKPNPKPTKWKPKTEAEKDKECETWCMKGLRPLMLLFTLMSPAIAFSSKLYDYCSRYSMSNIQVHAGIGHNLVAVMTGATDVDGMGYALATKLLDSGYSLVLGGRNSTKTQNVAQLLHRHLEHLGPPSSTKQYIVTHSLRLHDLHSVRAFGRAVRDTTSTSGIHLLVDLAGELDSDYSCRNTAKDHIERLLQVNTVAHHVLIEGLLPSLRDGAMKRSARNRRNDPLVPSRIVIVVDNVRAAPSIHQRGWQHLFSTNMQALPQCNPTTQYYTSQLLLSMYNFHLHQSIQSNPMSEGKITTLTLDPGATSTHFVQNSQSHQKHNRARRSLGSRLPPVRLLKYLFSWVAVVLPTLQRDVEHSSLGLYHVATSRLALNGNGQQGKRKTSQALEHWFFQDTLSSFVGCGLTKKRQVCGATDLKHVVDHGGNKLDAPAFEKMCMQVFNGIKKVAKENGKRRKVGQQKTGTRKQKSKYSRARGRGGGEEEGETVVVEMEKEEKEEKEDEQDEQEEQEVAVAEEAEEAGEQVHVTEEEEEEGL